MNSIKGLENIIMQHFNNVHEYTKNEFLNQLSEVLGEFKRKDKEIELKETYIKELEECNKQYKMEAKTYKAMIKGIFESL